MNYRIPCERGPLSWSRLRKHRFAAAAVAAVWVVASAPGCSGDSGSEVVIYTSVDQVFAAEVLAKFREQTGVAVRDLFDTEATKTTGLAQRLLAERGNPKADVYWSSEIFWTIRLAREGVFSSYHPTTASDIPRPFRDSAGLWTGVATRARVIAYNTKLVESSAAPGGLFDLLDAKWKGQIAIADPRFGTTHGHMGALLLVWGKEKFREFAAGLKANGVRVVDGNSTAVRLTGRGEVLVCLTDTDDVWAAQRNGQPVDLMYPDSDGLGTLVIPNSVAVVKKEPANPLARKLADFLVSAACERLLAESDSHNIPVRPAVADEFGTYRVPKIMRVDYAQVVDSIEPALAIWDDVMGPK